MAEGKPLMRLAEVADGESRGFKVWFQGGMLDGFLVRQGDRVFAYVNSCPHTGAPLDWNPDQFLDTSGSLVQCAIHGARFVIDSGLCVHGPCAGDRLQRVPTAIRDGVIWLLPDQPS
ncbi:MAG TPA: Rieske (2Fe-2S) protein [Sedimenticola thiotaurini]|uniref:Rieske (2Fe-2S) protein n=1 Tax=Sedimenticola thiotaurini TaxID=1543721 RepID=A0A831W545_9GAMM|nr:Rieske (2Fe-2S) protein [Sedimenticola thiotaurini]